MINAYVELLTIGTRSFMIKCRFNSDRFNS